MPVAPKSHIVKDVPIQKIEVDLADQSVNHETKQSTKPAAQQTTREMVDHLVAQYPVMVFSKSYCPYSMKAKNALNAYSMSSNKYHVVELDQRDDARDIQGVLGQLTGASTVPRVFINGKFVGGGDDIDRLHRSGKLKDMLVSAGAL